MAGTKEEFLKSKKVVSPSEKSKNSLKVLQLSRETPAAPRQRRDIMAQISVDTLYRKSIIFVVDIEDMLPGKDYI